MKRLIAATAALLGMFAFVVGEPARAVSDEAPHGPAGHPHHIHTGNGECHDYKGPDMESGARGLHHGSNMSGPDHGMWHGTCEFHNNHD
jgi:hypothetical protein